MRRDGGADGLGALALDVAAGICKSDAFLVSEASRKVSATKSIASLQAPVRPSVPASKEYCSA